MQDFAMFLAVMLGAPYVISAAIFPFLCLFFFLKEKFYDPS